MKYTIKHTKQFKKDIKVVVKRDQDKDLIKEVIALLAEGKVLPAKYKDHNLSGNFAGCRECHLKPNWLLIYEYDNDTLILYLTRTGSHSDLFR